MISGWDVAGITGVLPERARRLMVELDQDNRTLDPVVEDSIRANATGPGKLGFIKMSRSCYCQVLLLDVLSPAFSEATYLEPLLELVAQVEEPSAAERLTEE
jgi:hypothetical protein